MKKILVGCPTSSYHEYALEEYARAVKSLTYPNYDILLVDNSKDDLYFKKLKLLNLPTIKGRWHEEARERIVESRNILRQKVIDDDYDYFLNLDQDVIPPKDIIERLLQHKKRVITGIYFNYKNFTPRRLGLKNGKRYGELFPTIWSFTSKKGVIRNIKEEELTGGLIQIALCGSGCLFVHRSVLEKVEFHYNKENDKPERN